MSVRREKKKEEGGTGGGFSMAVVFLEVKITELVLELMGNLLL